MQSFEKYHPIMSVHYTMDWLTTFKIKDIFQLRADRQIAAESGREFDQKITDTARYINRSMRLVMSNNALLYGIRIVLMVIFLAVSVFGTSVKRKPLPKYASKPWPSVKVKAL